MNPEQQSREVRLIPIEKIKVLNPRERNQQMFQEIVESIKAIGLKKPITVTSRTDANGEHFHLVCGEGRLKAFKALGETEIPALIVIVNDEDAFIMSLAENIARRQYRPLELLAGIEKLHDKGYDKKTIAQKTGLAPDYVNGILTLLQQGEERLLVAVQKGRVPLNAALVIVGAGDDNMVVQRALQDAYESGMLRGKQLIHARQLIERRQILGRKVGKEPSRKRVNFTSTSLVRTYKKEVERQKLIIKKAGLAQQRLLFIVTALRRLLEDENFNNLLRAEDLETLPKYLAERLWPEAHSI
jgi:ParB family chromosome partitioning protein